METQPIFDLRNRKYIPLLRPRPSPITEPSQPLYPPHLPFQPHQIHAPLHPASLLLPQAPAHPPTPTLDSAHYSILSDSLETFSAQESNSHNVRFLSTSPCTSTHGLFGGHISRSEKRHLVPWRCRVSHDRAQDTGRTRRGRGELPGWVGSGRVSRRCA